MLIEYLEHLELAFSKHAHKGDIWFEKADCRLNGELLLKSMNELGEYAIIGSKIEDISCLEDVLLKPVQVQFQDDFVIWQLEISGNGILFDAKEKLKFCFHRNQINKVIRSHFDK